MLAKLRNHPKPVRFVAAKLLSKSGLGSPLTFKTNGFRLHFFPTGISEALWIEPTRRADDVNFIRATLKPGDVCVDAGANIGTTVIPASQSVGPNGCVICFEPNARTYGFLTANLRLNGCSNVTAHNAAVGAQSGSCGFTDMADDDRNHIANGNAVRMMTLDEATADVASIALLKIDVEGFEFFALQGAAQTLDKTRCINIEYFPEGFRENGCTTGDVSALLRKAGFTLYLQEGMKPLPEEVPHPYYNVVALHS